MGRGQKIGLFFFRNGLPGEKGLQKKEQKKKIGGQPQNKTLLTN